jgi:hypothetical protein
MEFNIEALDHGAVWFEVTDLSLDYGAIDPRVSGQLEPDVAEDIARRLLAAAATVRKEMGA